MTSNRELPLRIGTRGSELALWQAHHVRDELTRAHPGLRVEIQIISTEGDRIQDRPLQEVGGKGLFVKAIEARLLDGTVDLAVHSMKDMPAEGPSTLVVACTPARADARDALVSAAGTTLAALPAGARVGTGSLRRSALARRINPGIELHPIRGNVPTRVRRVGDGDLDAVILAAAGLTRLGMHDAIAELLDVDAFCPAPAQGVLALQCRREDAGTRRLAAALADDDATVCAAAERGFLRRLGASCSVPVGCHAARHGDALRVRGLIVDPSGEPCFERVIEGSVAQAHELGTQLAEALLARGGDAIIARLR